MSTNSTKQWIDFLTNRWLILVESAAIERVYMDIVEQAKARGEPLPIPPTFIDKPCRQIDMIKRHIIKTLPDAKFIDYVFEVQVPLSPSDFVEIYVGEQIQCVAKVRELVSRIDIP